MQHKTMGVTEWGILILLSLLWGGSFFFIGVAVQALPPLTIVAVRVLIAATLLVLFIYLTGRRLPSEWPVWRAFLVMGVLNNAIPFSLIVWGQTHIASGLAAILNAMAPVFAVVVAHYFTADEKLSGQRLLGVVLGFAGVVYLVGYGVLKGVGDTVLAELAVVAAAFSYALAGVFGRRFASMGVPASATATGQLMASSLLLIPLALLVDQPWSLALPSVSVMAAVLALAVLSTAVAYILYFQLLRRAGATNLLLVTFLIPVSAIVLGITFLDETLYARHFMGMAMIAAGLLFIDGRLFDGRLFRRLS
ncbi:MAG: DMT family transporter [Gammaproteobacteria bacterium]